MPLKSFDKSTPSSRTNKKGTTNKKKETKTTRNNKFITEHKDTLLDALYNAINTIRNKKEVVAEKEESKYYRDYKRYNKTLEALNKL